MRPVDILVAGSDEPPRRLPRRVGVACVAAFALLAVGAVLWNEHDRTVDRDRLDAAWVRDLRLEAAVVPGAFSLHVNFGSASESSLTRAWPVRVLAVGIDTSLGQVGAVVTDVTRGARSPGLPLRALPAFNLPRAGASMDLHFTDATLCSRQLPSRAAPFVVALRLPSGRRGTTQIPIRILSADTNQPWTLAVQELSCQPGMRSGG